MGTVVTIFIALNGLIVGSFLNAVIYRLPRECLSVVKQIRSRCPRCGVDLAWYDNIPLVSYFLFLRGRCRKCSKPISWRYPLIEALTSAGFVGLAYFDIGIEGLGDPGSVAGYRWALLLIHAVVLSALIVLSVVDIDFGILPDALTIGGIVLAPILVFAVPSVMPQPLFGPWSFGGAELAPRLTALANSLIGSVAAGGTLWFIGWLGEIVFRRPAMGLGDVKMFAAMGGFLGIWFLLALVIASFAGAIVGLAVLALAGGHYVRFGPFLALGMMISALVGPEVFGAIMRWLTP